jgi:protein involved in polysaccharide export with SLBB domain
MRPLLPDTLSAVLLSAFCLTLAGCHVLAPRSPTSAKLPTQDQNAKTTIQPGSLVEWTITGAGQPAAGTTGRSRVSPDGKLALGPLGSVPVAGLSLARAETAVEKQLRHYLKNPKAKLRLVDEQRSVSASIVEWTSDGEVRPVACRTAGEQPASTGR